MAKLITALNEYRPRIKYGATIDTDTLAGHISRGTSLNPGSIRLMLYELHDSFLFFFSNGNPINLERVGFFRPLIRSDGSFRIGFRICSPLRSRMNTGDFFQGRVINRQNIGLSKEEYIAIWNAEHPEDPINAG